MLIVIPSPCIDFLFRIVNRFEPVGAQTLLAELPIERFHDGVVRSVAAAIEVDLHMVHVRPEIYVAACELGSVITKAMLAWAHRHGATLRLIEPGKPNQNAYVESFNGRLHECLNEHCFTESRSRTRYNRDLAT